MKKTIFEEMGGTYIRQGYYFIPSFCLAGGRTEVLSAYGDKGINSI